MAESHKHRDLSNMEPQDAILWKALQANRRNKATRWQKTEIAKTLARAEAARCGCRLEGEWKD